MDIINNGTDKLGMNIFSQLEPVFRSELLNFISKNYVANIKTTSFQKKNHVNIIKFKRDMTR